MRGRRALLAAALAAALAAPAGAAWGHGEGLDTSRTADAGGAAVSVTAEAAPSGGGTLLTVTVNDERERGPAGDALLELSVRYGGAELLRDRFFAPGGVLRLQLAGGEGPAEVSGERLGPGGPWDGASGLSASGPLLGPPGLYEVEAEVLELRGAPAASGPLLAGLVVPEEARRPSGGVDFATRSYYDRVSSLVYDPAAREVSIEMPFDWSERSVAHARVVHVEARFPKASGFVAASYDGAANGWALPRESVSVDDYTLEGERIVHFVLLGDHLRSVKRAAGLDGPGLLALSAAASEETRFPATAYTPGDELRVDLTWEPAEVLPGAETTFVFTIRDGLTAEPLRQSSYDFVLLQGGEEVHRSSGTAVVGGGFERFGFAEGQTGPTVVRFEDLRGTGASTEFALVVVPEFGALAGAALAAGAAGAAALPRAYGSASARLASRAALAKKRPAAAAPAAPSGKATSE